LGSFVSMTYSFHPAATAEFEQAIEYYEGCREGLGYEFALEVYSTVTRILEYPDAWPVVEGEIRRSLLHRFPFGVLYGREASRIYILAVMHLHRDPDYWKVRIAG